MTANFIDRLRAYYQDVAKVLRGEASASKIFPNASDIGTTREQVYAEFLKQHAPAKCNVFFGGFLFDDDGNESKQVDIIVTTDTSPRFDFHNREGTGKAFSPVEGTLGVISVKSTLDKKQLVDALGNLASIPATKSLEGRVLPLFRIRNYDDWPLKVIYASSGLAPDTLIAHIDEFYSENPSIPINRRPNFIHVAGSSFVFRHDAGLGSIRCWDRRAIGAETDRRVFIPHQRSRCVSYSVDVARIAESCDGIELHLL
jgi:hypothetical protein